MKQRQLARFPAVAAGVARANLAGGLARTVRARCTRADYLLQDDAPRTHRLLGNSNRHTRRRDTDNRFVSAHDRAGAGSTAPGGCLLLTNNNSKEKSDDHSVARHSG